MKSPLLGSSWSSLFSSVFILCLHSSLSSPAPNLTIALDVLEFKRCDCPSAGIKGVGPNLYCHYLLVCLPAAPTSPQLLMSRTIINLPWKRWLLALHSAPNGLPLCSVHKHSWTPLRSSSTSPSYLQQWRSFLYTIFLKELLRLRWGELTIGIPWNMPDLSGSASLGELDSQTGSWKPQWNTAGRRVSAFCLPCLSSFPRQKLPGSGQIRCLLWEP